MIDEGSSTYIMYVSCWKARGSPPLNQSPNTLEAFDGKVSIPYGSLTSFPIMLEGKTVKLEVEVIDANLNYNLILGQRFTNAMLCVVSSLFFVLHFPHKGKIVTVDQLAFFFSGSSNGNVPYVGNTNITYESIGVGLLKDSDLMRTFSLPPPHVTSVNIISTSYDSWIIPSLDQVDSFGDVMLLSPAEKAYQAGVLASASTFEIHTTLSMHIDAYS